MTQVKDCIERVLQVLLETTARDHLVPYRLVTSSAVGTGGDASSSVAQSASMQWAQ